MAEVLTLTLTLTHLSMPFPRIFRVLSAFLLVLIYF